MKRILELMLLLVFSTSIALSSCQEGEVEDCAGVCGGYSMVDDCGVCSSNYYCYDYVTHVTNTDLPCDGPTEMLVMPDSSYNQDWNASCSDCAGTPNGDAAEDECGVCNGDNSSCGNAVSTCFNVDMNSLDVPNTDYAHVVINGSWNGWNGWGVELTDENLDGIFSGCTESIEGDFDYVVAVTGSADGWSGWGLQYGQCDGTNFQASAGDESSIIPGDCGGAGGTITFELDGLENCGFISVTGTFDNWSGWGANTDTEMQVTLEDGDYEFVILCVDTTTDGWWNDIWGNSIQYNAPLGSECDYLAGDEFANYGFNVNGTDMTISFCAGSCDATCVDCDTIVDCAGNCGGYSMVDACGVCHDAYCYDYVTHVTNTDFPCDGPTEMLVAADSDYNADWNGSCDTEPEYSSFTWDYFTDNTGGSNYPTSCESDNCEQVELITLTGGMITSSGNLYGVSSPLVININSEYSFIESINLTLSTLGTELDYSATMLAVGDVNLTPSYELLSQEPDDWGGASSVVLYSWSDLSNVSFDGNWTVEFSASGNHMSLDQVILEWNIDDEDCCGVAGGDSSSCNGSGDINLDGETNINDIVAIVDGILNSTEYSECEINYADATGDGSINVLDVIAIVDIILGGGVARNSLDVPAMINLFQYQNILSYDSDVDGLVGFELTINHEEGCNFILDERAFIADYKTYNNTTKMVIVIDSGDNLFKASTDFEIVDMLIGSVHGEIDVELSTIPEIFGFGEAYPNPFNPITSFEFSMPISGFLSIKVYNLVGQVIDVIHEGNLAENSYTFSWNAENVPSGMYILKSEFNNQLDVQKVMLIK